MGFRAFIVGLFFFHVSVALATESSLTTQSPNVLLICVDDLKPALGCYGDKLAITPHIDRLAARSMRFDHAYCNQAVCSPSRNSLLTGLRPQTIGIYDLDTNFRKGAPQAVTLGQYFKRHGYRAESLGKIYHVGHGNIDDADSWSVPAWRPEVGQYVLKKSIANQRVNNRGPRGPATEAADVPDSTYADGMIADEAIKRLQAAKQRGGPFFIAVGFAKPHLPFVAPKKYWDLYDPAKLPLATVRTGPAGAPAYAPKAGGELRRYADIPKNGALSDQLQRRLIHGYYAATSYMDAQAGRVLTELEQLGLADNTVVVLWGDHGWHLGDHGLWCKHTNYEQAARIPLLVAGPNIAPGVSAALIETADIYPTLAEISGLPAPNGLDGRSFAATLRNPQTPHRDHAIHVYPRSTPQKGSILGRAIRTNRYRLVEWKKPGAPADTAEWELYDYQTDPLETKNLATEQPAVVSQLRQLLAQHPEAQPQLNGQQNAQRKKSGNRAAAVTNKPNVVVVLVDDMGYGDIAAHGNPVIQTPHLDRLHADAARLTNFHVDPTCSPTRAALITGKYSHRAKVWHTIAAGNHLRANELTMADAFRANGYRTAMFGKWHLGSNLPYRPIDRGFDEWLGQGDGGTGTTDDYFVNDRVNDHYLHNGEWKQIDGWGPEVFFDATIQFIRDSKQANQPFFTYLCTYVAHSPLTLPNPAWADHYTQKVPANTAFFFASIEKVDQQIGKLRAALADEGLDRDTILIFLTDNGGTFGVDVFNAGMRGEKGDVYDGGHRVPCFIHWPAGGLRSGHDLPALNAHIDVLPTLVEMCGLKLPREVDFDGRSFRDQLLDSNPKVLDRTLCVEHQRTFRPEKWNGAAAMNSRWRLVNNRELYDIHSDPGQTKNVIAAHSDVVAKLRADFDAYWTKVTPGDRDRVEFIVGDQRDRETFLHPSDWYLPEPPWHHARVAAGPDTRGDWLIRAARSGVYRFEVRRWPREADAALAGVPQFQKTIDAWDAGGPKPDLIYGGSKTKFQRLPVAAVRLTVGDRSQALPAAKGAAEVSFDFELEVDRPLAVKAELMDSLGKVVAGGYYVYCGIVER